MQPPYGPPPQEPYGQPQQPMPPNYGPPQQPMLPYGAQPYYPQQPAARQHPRKVVSRRKMGFVMHLFHWCMIVMTCGLWTPVYLSGLRRRKTVTRYH